MEILDYSNYTFYSASQFHHLLRIERKRTSRSKKSFLLTLLDFSALEGGKHYGYMLEKTKEILISCTRETDLLGWYENRKIMGIIFTEMVKVDKKSIETISRKIHKKLSDNFTTELANQIVMSPHVFGSLEDNEKLLVKIP